MPTITIICSGYRALLEVPEQDKAVRFGVDIPISMLDGATYYAQARKVSKVVAADRMVIEKGCDHGNKKADQRMDEEVAKARSLRFERKRQIAGHGR